MDKYEIWSDADGSPLFLGLGEGYTPDQACASLAKKEKRFRDKFDPVALSVCLMINGVEEMIEEFGRRNERRYK